MRTWGCRSASVNDENFSERDALRRGKINSHRNFLQIPNGTVPVLATIYTRVMRALSFLMILANMPRVFGPESPPSFLSYKPFFLFGFKVSSLQCFRTSCPELYYSESLCVSILVLANSPFLTRVTYIHAARIYMCHTRSYSPQTCSPPWIARAILCFPPGRTQPALRLPMGRTGVITEFLSLFEVTNRDSELSHRPIVRMCMTPIYWELFNVQGDQKKSTYLKCNNYVITWLF